MGALAPSSLWLPRDDLLLKQGVEGGASLESLAKGAKRFSRRFTLQELQERWYALLYDPVVSAEASVHMFQLDTYASTAQSKSHKEAKHTSGKRKAESVRKSYYSMYKRIRNDPFEMMDMDFLDETGYCDTGNRDNPSSVDCFFADQGANVFGNSEPIYGGSCHPFPEQHSTDVTSPGEGVSASAFHGGIHEFNGNTQESPAFCEKNSVSRDQNAVEDLVQFKESSDLVMKRSPTLFQYTDDGADACSGFGCEVLKSSAPGCGTSPNYGYSPLPEMPRWIADEDFNGSVLADALGMDLGNPVGMELGNPCVVANEMTVPEIGTACSLSDLIGQMSHDNMKDSAANAEYFKELSNSLLNCSTDELLLVDELLVDSDGFGMIDNTYIENPSPLLLDFPDEKDMPKVGLTETQVAFDDHTKTSVGAHGGESGAKGLFSHVDQHLVGSVKAQKILSAVKVNPAFPELRNGVICCVLNTEDPEIPNNDDVFLPFRIPSMSTCPMGDTEFDTAIYPSTASADRLISHTRVTYGPIIMDEPNNCDISSRSSVPFQPEVASGSQTDAQIVTYELPSSEVHPLASLTHCYNETSAAGAGMESIAIAEHPNIFNHDPPESLIPKDGRASDSHLRFQRSREGSEWELVTTSVTQIHEPLHTAQQCFEKKVPDSVTDFPMSDEEESSCESEGDVPYCSDVEALILDMDLIPDDQDLYSNERVLKYQIEDAKRIIMRLEQTADSCNRRALSAHGAFAVLCGRHSKHFIKKTEVLLGRATEDVQVDIDLSTETRANKISRRQATIKVDIDGSFHLKNYGKQPIHVNGKEVFCGEEVALVSGSLLEVRGIAFIFKTNRAYVKHHFNYLAKES